MTCGRSTGPTNTQREKVSPEKKENILGVTRCSAAKSTPERADCNVLPQNENCWVTRSERRPSGVICHSRGKKCFTQAFESGRIAAIKENPMSNPTSSSITRRQFLYGAGASAALFQIVPGSLLRGAERISANEKVNVAGIGIGSRGGADIDEVAGAGHNLVALCDVDDKYAAKQFAKYPTAKQFKDFRVMLDK